MPAGVIVGIGVAAMHYTGMAALRFPGTLAYRPDLWAASLGIAVTAATAALYLASRARVGGHNIVAALVMAAAICGMHYVGMAATVMRIEALALRGIQMGDPALASAVAFCAFGLLGLALVSASADRRLSAARSRARVARERAEATIQGLSSAMEALLRTTPDAVVVSYVNTTAEVKALTGNYHKLLQQWAE